MHPSTYEYLKPTADQFEAMAKLREAARVYGEVLDCLPAGPDKDHIIRQHRETAMWANVCITRFADGEPRPGTGDADTDTDMNTSASQATGSSGADGLAQDFNYVRRDAVSLAIDFLNKTKGDPDAIIPLANKFADFILSK